MATQWVTVLALGTGSDRCKSLLAGMHVGVLFLLELSITQSDLICIQQQQQHEGVPPFFTLCQLLQRIENSVTFPAGGYYIESISE